MNFPPFNHPYATRQNSIFHQKQSQNIYSSSCYIFNLNSRRKKRKTLKDQIPFRLGLIKIRKKTLVMVVNKILIRFNVNWFGIVFDQHHSYHT